LRLLTVARLVPIKGHALALRALSLLPQTAGPFEYHIVGDGPERPALESLAAQLGLAGAVRFHGAADPSALLRHYASCHLFLLTSQSIEGDAEGQGLAVQEAQAAGLPVVVTRHGGLPEGMREGRSGLVVPENDPPALARALADLAAHPERWIEMGRAGRAFVESHFDSPRLLERLLDLYHSTVHLARS
jgi:colanic acid/amylovoran biosynthesis glycosyltransferase